MNQERKIVLIAHNIRSCHNVGSILRTSEGLGIMHVYLSGYTPYPKLLSDERLPHVANKIDKQIHKTALGAEKSVSWSHVADIFVIINTLKAKDFEVVALEQHRKGILMPSYKPPANIAIVLGREVEGIEDEVLNHCDKIIEIPMFGQKESFNVVQAAAMAMYHCTFR